MSNIAIKAENVSKAYQLGQFSTGTVSHDLERWLAKIRGKEDPFLKVGETNDRSVKGNSNIVWSLKDISFEIEKGDAVGIIGRNGAGKSTLLKVLSKVTSPTKGLVTGSGRIASLLEVGTGFHPELTGRENIYLNGAILGMRKAEIRKQFDAIVEFSGVERYIDTPVKRYSSGMYVRLAFAVAGHLESEILIVDEVLAVGDAEFQKKCLGKMNEVTKGEGRTVLFVSHNMGSIMSLCNNVIILKNGSFDFQGKTKQGVEKYLESNSQLNSSFYQNLDEKKNGSFIKQLKVLNSNGEQRSEFKFDEKIVIQSIVKILKKDFTAKIGIQVTDRTERIIFTSEVNVKDFVDEESSESILNFLIEIPSNILVPNSYHLQFALHIPNIEFLVLLKDVLQFTILDTGTDFHMYGDIDYGCVFMDCKWKLFNNVVS